MLSARMAREQPCRAWACGGGQRGWGMLPGEGEGAADALDEALEEHEPQPGPPVHPRQVRLHLPTVNAAPTPVTPRGIARPSARPHRPPPTDPA